ncbi:MAG: hypothetical protein ABIA75_01040 [Candidatus Neomarinimicrobiota bacterium]
MKNIAPIVYRLIPIFFLLTTAVSAAEWETTAAGRLAVVSMENAPYPDTSRAAGYTRQDEFYPPEIHYCDPSVALFVPAGFQAGQAVDLLFYFHGHGNNLHQALDQFRLREMVAASGRNVIMVFPQGPKDARDSGCGKLESAGGFERLVAEVLDTLTATGIIAEDKIGTIILSGHSGAYKVIGRILHYGGLTAKISAVYLLDASYGQLDVFTDWVAGDKTVRLRSIFTDHLAPENVTIMKNLSRRGIKFTLLAEESVTAADLKQRVLFLHAANLTHNETVNWLERFLAGSALRSIPELRRKQ